MSALAEIDKSKYGNDDQIKYHETIETPDDFEEAWDLEHELLCAELRLQIKLELYIIVRLGVLNKFINYTIRNINRCTKRKYLYHIKQKGITSVQLDPNGTSWSPSIKCKKSVSHVYNDNIMMPLQIIIDWNWHNHTDDPNLRAGKFGGEENKKTVPINGLYSKMLFNCDRLPKSKPSDTASNGEETICIPPHDPSNKLCHDCDHLDKSSPTCINVYGESKKGLFYPMQLRENDLSIIKKIPKKPPDFLRVEIKPPNTSSIISPKIQYNENPLIDDIKSWNKAKLPPSEVRHLMLERAKAKMNSINPTQITDKYNRFSIYPTTSLVDWGANNGYKSSDWSKYSECIIILKSS